MKKNLLLLFFAFLFFGGCKTGSKKNISLGRFSELAGHGDMSMVYKIISDYGYKMIDSMSQGLPDNRVTTYMAGDGERHGDVFIGDLLKCTIDKKHKVSGLQFITTDKQVYKELKEQVSELRFIPAPPVRQWSDDKIEVDMGNKEEDTTFRKDNITLRTFILNLSGKKGYVFELDRD
jgi:hypothetical protein